MSDPTIAEERREIAEAVEDLARITFDGEPENFSVAADKNNESAHLDSDETFLARAERILGVHLMSARIVEQFSEPDSPVREMEARLREPRERLERSLTAFQQAKSRAHHPAGKRR